MMDRAQIGFPGCCSLIRLLTYFSVCCAGLFRKRLRENQSVLYANTDNISSKTFIVRF